MDKEIRRDTYNIVATISLKGGGERRVGFCPRTNEFAILQDDPQTGKSESIGPGVAYDAAIGLAREVIAGSSYHRTLPGLDQKLALGLLAADAALMRTAHRAPPQSSCVASPVAGGGAAPPAAPSSGGIGDADA